MNKNQQISIIDFSKETSLIAYLDLSNMNHWRDTLKWEFSIFAVVRQLLLVNNMKEVRIYFGENDRDFVKSNNFLKQLRKTGAIVITKKVKWIKKDITKSLFVKQGTLGLFDQAAHAKLEELIDCLRKQGIATIEEPKCNFDVEIALDMLDAIDKVSAILLFSGDSDFKEPLERLKLRGKNIFVVGVRGSVAGELWSVLTKYINFGQWYKGSRKAKIPLIKSGTA